MRREVLGPEHPDVAETLSSLGDLLKAQGHYDDAEPLYQEALAILRSRFDETHPWTRQVYAALVELYDAWGKPDLAAPYRQRPG
jgi:tetratricopeptide (TPR) repeat protein